MNDNDKALVLKWLEWALDQYAEADTREEDYDELNALIARIEGIPEPKYSNEKSAGACSHCGKPFGEHWRTMLGNGQRFKCPTDKSVEDLIEDVQEGRAVVTGHKLEIDSPSVVVEEQTCTTCYKPIGNGGEGECQAYVFRGPIQMMSLEEAKKLRPQMYEQLDAQGVNFRGSTGKATMAKYSMPIIPKCPKCGTECPSGTFFCPNGCGKELMAEELKGKSYILDNNTFYLDNIKFYKGNPVTFGESTYNGTLESVHGQHWRCPKCDGLVQNGRECPTCFEEEK